jgi:hypothetical protein
MIEWHRKERKEGRMKERKDRKVKLHIFYFNWKRNN